MTDSDVRLHPIPSTSSDGLQDPDTETRDVGPEGEGGEDAEGRSTRMDDLVAPGSTPQAPVIDLGVTLPDASLDRPAGSAAGDEGPDAEAPVFSRREVLGVAVGHGLDESREHGQDPSPATGGDDKANSDHTDEHGEEVDTSDIGYDIPTGGKEPPP